MCSSLHAAGGDGNQSDRRVAMGQPAHGNWLKDAQCSGFAGRKGVCKEWEASEKNENK